MQRQVKGFTMVEISLAMAFIGVLSLIILTIIMDAVASYRRGITLNQINTTGADLVDEIRRAVQASPARTLKEECTAIYSGGLENTCISDNGQSLMVAKRYTTVQVDGENIENVPIYGVFCTGKYSYIWNSGYLFNDSAEAILLTDPSGIRLKYRTPEYVGETTGSERLLKVNDEDRMVCKVVAGYKTGTTTGTAYTDYNTLKEKMTNSIDITSVAIDEPPEDILQNDEFSNLALYDLAAAIPAKTQGINSAFYTMSFILGTTRSGANITVANNNCKPPEDEMSDFDYCAINKFNFAAQAIGG